MAWQNISPEVNMKGCKNCCISSAMNGTNVMLWNDSKKDEDVRSECE